MANKNNKIKLPLVEFCRKMLASVGEGLKALQI